MMSLRMMAVMATLAGFPASSCARQSLVELSRQLTPVPGRQTGAWRCGSFMVIVPRARMSVDGGDAQVGGVVSRHHHQPVHGIALLLRQSSAGHFKGLLAAFEAVGFDLQGFIGGRYVSI